MSAYRLGLDLGSNSIGWALLAVSEKNAEKENGIIDLGVRVFPEGVDRDNSGGELSKNETRRIARGGRRQRARRHMRRDMLTETLSEVGMLPVDEDELEELLNEADIDKKERPGHPYKLRAKGLNEKLSLYEFGRVLFHLNQRRGFKSNRKTGKAKKEDGKVNEEATELQRLIEENGCRTLGEYFAQLNPKEQRIRDRYTFRSMYENEFDLLWEKQAKYYPELLTDNLHHKIRDEIIFYQRPLKPCDELIGKCELEEEEIRCPKGNWHARRYRLLQDLNNMKIEDRHGGSENLTREQREIVLEELEQKKKVKFNKLRDRLVKLYLMEVDQQFNLEEEGQKKEMDGDAFAVSMRAKKLFGKKRWNEMSTAEQQAVNEAVLELEDEELYEKAIGEYGFSEEQADALLKVSLPQRYMSFSLKAIKKLLPLMEKGMIVPHAIKEIYKQNEVEKENALAQLDMPADLRNPIVQKALFEVRKVVNAIIREYGKPKEIVIEMARDLQNSKKRREDIQKKIRENKRENDNARENLMTEMGIASPSRDDITKYKLWNECGRICPYTGRSISQNELFGIYQIEHILPYSRSLDDSYMNKTLCHADENRKKGNKTPYEAYSGDEERYDQVKQRIAILPKGKRLKFLQKEIKLDDFIGRQLNDTRYISREVVKYMKRLGIHVRGSRGQATATLRRLWGLNSILNPIENSKTRDDHRHHAVDAVVTALTTARSLRDLARIDGDPNRPQLPVPWEGLREELAEKVNMIKVSHRVSRKVSGPLHKETAYGPTKEENLYVYRKTLESLTPAMVEKIRDTKVREMVEGRLREHGINPGEKGGKFPTEVWKEPLHMYSKKGKKIPIRKVRIKKKSTNVIIFNDKKGQPYRAVDSGNNHHVEIIENTNTNKREACVITLFEAVRRIRNNEQVVQRDHGPGTRLICSLAINEMVEMEDKKGQKDLYRIQKMDINGQIYFRHHTATTIDYEGQLIRKQANLFTGRKVTIDPLGRIFPAND